MKTLEEIRQETLLAQEEKYGLALHNLQVDRALAGLDPLDEPLSEVDITRYNFGSRLTRDFDLFCLGNYHDMSRPIEEIYWAFGAALEGWLEDNEWARFQIAPKPGSPTDVYMTKGVEVRLKLTFGGA